MIEKGAGGETKTAVRKAMALPADISDQTINNSTILLMKSLHSLRDVELVIANALWADTSATIAPGFVRVCQEVYDAVVRTLDLNEPSAAVAINEWVAQKTRGKIPQIVTPGAIAGSPAVITNAVYFKGKFRFPFRRRNGAENVSLGPRTRKIGAYDAETVFVRCVSGGKESRGCCTSLQGV